MKKIIFIAIIIITIIITNFLILLKEANCVTILPVTELHSAGNCGQLLKYKGVIVKTYYAEYNYNGVSYPAYCLDKHLEGVSDELSYSVTTNTLITDLGLWRFIINGYPYKTIEELGVANREEAFTATKQAIYCYLFENTPEDYEPIGEAGVRTLNALKMIVANGEASTETQIKAVTNIVEEDEEWKEETIEKINYLSKTYSVESNISFENYEISIDGELPKGTILTNMEGEETKSFSAKDKFKIMIPKENIKEDGKFTLNVNTEVKTKPVIYGASPNSQWQNYALTAYMYEEAFN